MSRIPRSPIILGAMLAGFIALPHTVLAGETSDLLSDCLARASSKQPQHRPISPLVRDLVYACGGEMAAVERATGKTGRDLYWSYFLPIILPLHPVE